MKSMACCPAMMHLVMQVQVTGISTGARPARVYLNIEALSLECYVRSRALADTLKRPEGTEKPGLNRYRSVYMRRSRLLWIQAVHHLQRLHFRFRFSPSSTLDRSQSSARDSCLWGFVRFSNRLSVVSSIKTQIWECIGGRCCHLRCLPRTVWSSTCVTMMLFE